MDIEIRPARVRDAGDILKLQFLSYQSEAALYDDYALPPLTQTLCSLLEDYDTHHLLAAYLGGEVVGSVRGCMEEGTCHIGRLVVHPRLQRNGLGVRLMREIEDRFAAADRYELFTGHLSGTLRLYFQIGYKEFRRQEVSSRLQIVYLEKLGTVCKP